MCFNEAEEGGGCGGRGREEGIEEAACEFEGG